MKTVVFTFGRMNPMTTGHAKLVDKIRSVARLEGGDPLVFLSHTNDKKKNPLPYMDKVRFAQSAFGKIVQRSNSNTIIKVLKELESGYDRVVLVVGSDRVDDMRTLLNKYNGQDYTFQDIQVVSAGERDPDADDVSGMSASKMRQFAVDDDIDSFTMGLPGPLQRKAQEVFDSIRKGMGIKEDIDLEESRLKKIAALGLALGLASAGDGAYAKDHETKKWNQTYNSLTIKQKKQVDDMIQFESQSLTEAFDKPYNYRVTYKSKDTFLAKFETDEGDEVQFAADRYDDPEDNEVWEIYFERNYAVDKTGGGDAMRIFATVIQIIQDFIKQMDPEQMTFSALKGEQRTKEKDSREKLYSRLIKKYLSKKYKVDERPAAVGTIWYFTKK